MNDPLKTGMQLEAEMSGLRSQLTSLRTQSIDMSTDLLAVLGPMPTYGTVAIAASAPPESIEVVDAVRITPPHVQEQHEF